MSASDNFITRPVLTTVCSLLILIGGLISIPLLPIENLPDIAPPTVRVNARYDGADACFTVVLGGFGVAVGMVLEAVRQLQATKPEPEYHQHHRLPREDPPIR